MDLMLARTLYNWARCNTSRQAQLEGWLTTAVEEIASGNGASVISTTANNVSVTFSTGGLTNSAWAATVSKAMDMIESRSASTVIGVIR